MGVVDQVVLAFNARNRLATVLGFIAGGIVPVATYVEAHSDLNDSLPLYSQAASFMVLGGLVFSAKTVFTWAKRAFRDGWKAAGFVVLLEGVMITSHVPVLPLVLLAILVAINGIATGCILSLDRANASAAGVASGPRRAPRAQDTRAPSFRQRLADDEESQDAAPPTALSGARSRRGLRERSPQERFAFADVKSAVS